MSSCSKVCLKRNKKIIWKQEDCSSYWNPRRPQQPPSSACHHASVVKKHNSAAMDTEALRLHFILLLPHFSKDACGAGRNGRKKSCLTLSSRSRRGDFFAVRKVLILSLNRTFGHWGLFPQQKLSFGFSSSVLHLKFWGTAKPQTASVVTFFSCCYRLSAETKAVQECHQQQSPWEMFEVLLLALHSACICKKGNEISYSLTAVVR